MKDNMNKEYWGEFEYKENYMALLACILTEDSSAKCIRDICCVNFEKTNEEYVPTLSEEERMSFRIYNKSEDQRNKVNEVKVTNVITKEEVIYINKTELSKEFKISEDLINYYIRTKKHFNKKYEFVSLKKKNIDYSAKKVEVRDMIEDKVYKFDNQAAVCRFLGCVHKTIKVYDRTGNYYKNRYKIEIIKGN